MTTSLTNTFFGSLALQSDGKIVVLGLASAAKVARFTTVGALDTTFGTAGIATAGCGGFSGDLALQPDGKIVAAVGACAFRFLSDGSPDPAFGTGGVVTLPGWSVHALDLQANGGIVIAGQRDAVAAVGHLFAGGTIDTGFGDGGVATEGLAPSLAQDVVVQSDGKIVAVNLAFGVARFRANGSPDKSFGTDGATTVTVTGVAEAYRSSRLAVQGDGKIVVAGAGTFTIDPPFGGTDGFVVLVRLDADGTLDATYGDAGIQQDSADVLPSAIVLQPDGKAVVVGSVAIPPFVTRWQVARHIGFAFTCPSTPAGGCKTGVTPLAGSLKLATAADPRKRKEQWAWQKGADVLLADFGDPIGGDRTTFCFYDESGMTPALRSFAIVPGAGLCKGKPCWTSKGSTALQYKDSTRTRFGIALIKLQAGTDGTAKLQLTAQKGSTAVPPLPLALPTRVQMITEGGACFESVFSTTGVSRSDTGKFQGKSD